jgi:hypothetical protein
MSFAALITIGTTIGNVAGAAAASLGGVLGGAAGTALGAGAGAGGLGTMAGATMAGSAGSALAGTALAPAASTTALANLAAAGAGATAPTSLASGVGAGAAGKMGLAGLQGAVPASPGVGVTSAGVTAPTAGGGMSTAALPSAAQGGLGAVGNFLGQTATGQVVDQGVKGIQAQQQRASVNAANRNAARQQQQEGQKAKELGGNLMNQKLAHGGSVNLENGQFIIPADVVSALGNGSTKAGAKFLDEFFGKV